MPVNPVWPGVVLALTARVVGASPAPTPVPTPVVPFRVPEFPRAQLLSGKPFPAVTPFAPLVARPDRTLYVSARAKDGDGSKARPWGDLQAALREVEPGDQLRVGPGDYAGPLRIDERCREGLGRQTIQVVFDGKAKVSPGGDVGEAVLTIARPYWHLTGIYVALDQSASPGISIDGSAHDVTLDGARVSGGSAPSVVIGAETVRVRIGNARISKSRLDKANPDAVGILVSAGARDALLANNRMSENPGGSIRVRAPGPGGKPAGGLQVVGNTIRDDAATAIDVEAADGIRISGNTITDSPTWTGTRGIALGNVERAVVQFNRIEDCA
ncbi:MAG TPA: right-handed parallel beta-helix repeat-containing protein, partial [Thermoanaerobaculia bacterium]